MKAIRRAAAARATIMLSVVAGGFTGCIAGSLATTTGLRPAGSRWSIAPRQSAHVGEEVHFDFVLHNGAGSMVSPLGVADYCVASIGSYRVEAVPDDTGHFAFSFRLDRASPGDEITVEVTAYQQRGRRDFVQVGGQWLEAQSPLAELDKPVARASVRLAIYQSKVSLRIARPPDDLDPQTGVLRLIRMDGSATSVYIDRPGRPGFRLAGPGQVGYYEVDYEPSGDEVNVTGVTEFTFTIHDVGGQRHTVLAQLETP